MANSHDERILALFQAWSGEEPLRADRLPGAGSNRAYYRLTGGPCGSVIGCVGTSRDENHAFVALARHFRGKDLPVPTVLAVSDDEMCYLQEDLGTVSLFDLLKPGREAGGHYGPTEKAMLAKTIRLLPRLQVLGAEGLDWSVCYPQPEFDEMNVLFDLNYFKYCFLKATGIDFQEVQLETDFRQMARDLTADDSGYGFMYRDFQARNVMVAGAEGGGSPADRDAGQVRTCFIDFQGGRRGPFYYDVASFLWQASAKYSDDLRRELTDEYYDALRSVVAEAGREKCSVVVPEREDFDRRLQRFVLFRTLQVLGAYGFRGYFERKRHFLQSIPPAIENLRQLTVAPSRVLDGYPCLQSVLEQLCQQELFAPEKTVATPSQHDGKGPLVVRVFSFSYKKGIPEDTSGNGGGYVFDCRSTHNPGRYDAYKQLTGLDAPVIQFLEDDGEITTFLESVFKLADAHVERYQERGFTSLMFSFGCTGGQHRSVYSAQHLAEHLHAKYGIEVRLCHREQNISQTFLP